MPKVKLPRQWKWGSVPEEILNSELSIYAKILIAAITFHAFDDGPAWPGQARLSRLCSCSGRAIIRATKELEDAGFLSVSRTKGKVNIYEFLSKTSDSQSLVTSAPVTPSHGLPVTDSHTNKTKSNETQIAAVAAQPSISKQFITWWMDAFLKEFGSKYFFSGGKDGAAIKRLAGAYSLDELTAMVQAGWKMPDRRDFSPRTVCKTISGFSSMVNQIVVPKAKPAERELTDEEVLSMPEDQLRHRDKTRRWKLEADQKKRQAS